MHQRLSQVTRSAHTYTSAPTSGSGPSHSAKFRLNRRTMRERRLRLLRRESLQQSVLPPPHHRVERIEQCPAFLGEKHVDIPTIVAAGYAADILLRLHGHQHAAQGRLLHHRAVDDFADGDAVTHRQHGQDAPAGDVDPLEAQFLDQVGVELVGESRDEMREKALEQAVVGRAPCRSMARAQRRAASRASFYLSFFASGSRP